MQYEAPSWTDVLNQSLCLGSILKSTMWICLGPLSYMIELSCSNSIYVIYSIAISKVIVLMFNMGVGSKRVVILCL